MNRRGSGSSTSTTTASTVPSSEARPPIITIASTVISSPMLKVNGSMNVM